MAEDVFNLTNIESAKNALEGMRNTARDTADQIRDWNTAFETFGRARAEIEKYGKLGIFDEQLIHNVENATKELGKMIVNMGGDVDKLVRSQARHKKILGDELEFMKNMVREGKKYGDQEESLGKKTISAFGKRAKQVGNYAQQMAGVQISLIGIIALIIEMGNRMNRISGAAKQASAQFGEVGKSAKGIYGAIDRIALGWHKGDEAAMNYVRSLARAGMPHRDLLKLSDKLMANEFIIGRSVDQQVADIGALATNFKLTGSMADYYLNTVWETTKSIPYLSPTQAIEDWKTLIDQTKVYNTDLLGTLALYNTLMRKDLAKQLGLGDAPRAIRREIVTTVAGFSKNLEDGWKAALGKGTTAAARILNFEKLLPTEQFARMAEFITEKTAEFTGETREIAVRQLLKQFGFTAEETRKVLAEAFAGGGLTPSKLQELVVETGKSREAMKATEKKAAENRDKLIREGLKIATNLTSFEQRMKDWVKRNLTEPLGKLANAIAALTDKLPSVRDVGEAGKGLKNLPKGEAERIRSEARAAAGERARAEYLKKFGGASHIAAVKGALPGALLKGVADIPMVAARGEELRKSGGAGLGPRTTAAAEVLSLIPQNELERAIQTFRSQGVQEAVQIVADVLAKQNLRSQFTSITPMSAHYQSVMSSPEFRVKYGWTQFDWNKLRIK